MAQLETILRNKQIFSVEDNISNQALEQLLLERYGAKVFFDRQGYIEQIIPKLKRMMPVDLIIMDLMLPFNNNGYRLFEQIRQYPQFAHIPVVAVSASEPSLEMPKVREYGFAGFISKPIHILLFPQQIATILQNEEVWYTRDNT